MSLKVFIAALYADKASVASSIGFASAVNLVFWVSKLLFRSAKVSLAGDNT